jgi:acylphosphatase
MIARRYVISGRVQGVGFRWYVMRRAQALKLRGVVRNLPDGRVEVVAAGSDEAVKRFEDDLREGPSLARVTGIDQSELPADQIWGTSFKVR